MRLAPNSISTWADFKLLFLDQFFPSTKTSALRKEILGVTQKFDETLSDYWARYRSLLDACPNHIMNETEIYSTFYEGMNRETKELANSASGEGLPYLKVSEAKSILGKLLSTKRAYDNPHDPTLRRAAASIVATEKDDKMKQRMEKLEKALLAAIEKKVPKPPAEKTQGNEARSQHQIYSSQEDMDPMAQANVASHWNPNGSWNPGRQQDAPWRDHPNFRCSEGNQNQPNQS